VGRDRTEPRGPSRVDWRLRCPAQGTARPGETRVRLSEMVTGLIAAGSRPAAHGGSIMPQWHAPCWRRVLPCPGGPRAAYCAASFIWFCLSQWPLFRNLARSGRQGQSRPRKTNLVLLFCHVSLVFLVSGMAVLFLARPTPVPSQNAASSDAQFFPASKDEVNEIAIQNLLFGL